MKAFLQVRQKVKQYKGTVPVIDSHHKLKKDELIDRCFDEKNKPTQQKLFRKRPTLVVTKNTVGD